jgi:hypothetical protein
VICVSWLSFCEVPSVGFLVSIPGF